MSEQQEGAPPASGEPPKEAPKVASITLTNEALNARLAEERESHEKKLRASFLKDLGVEKFEDAKSRIAAAQKLEQESLTELEKRDRRIKELEPFQTSAERVTTRFKTIVDDQFGKLPEAAQKAIDEHAGGDAEKRFDMIELMRKSGALEALGKAAEPPKGTPPISSGPNPPPPPGSAPSAFQVWEQKRAQSPMAADIYYQANQREIERTRPASA